MATTAILVFTAYRYGSRVPSWTYTFIRLLARPTAWLLHKIGMTANQISAFRLFSPFAFYGISKLGGSRRHFVITYLVLAYTDGVDGVMASRFEKKPHGAWGVLLDSLGDKFMNASAFLFFYTRYPTIITFIIGGEILTVGLVVGHLIITALRGGDMSSGISRIRATIVSKTKHVLEIVTVVFMTMSQATSGWAESVIYVTSAAATILIFIAILQKIKSVLG